MVDPNNTTDIIQILTANWTNFTIAISALITSIIGVASIIVKITPNKKDDTILAKIIAIVKIISLNKNN